MIQTPISIVNQQCLLLELRNLDEVCVLGETLSVDAGVSGPTCCLGAQCGPRLTAEGWLLCLLMAAAVHSHPHVYGSSLSPRLLHLLHRYSQTFGSGPSTFHPFQARHRPHPDYTNERRSPPRLGTCVSCLQGAVQEAHRSQLIAVVIHVLWRSCCNAPRNR